ncbi:MAG: hypothetical protein ACLFSQ_07165 [Candidatus Zixiibacteriota bacterium]
MKKYLVITILIVLGGFFACADYEGEIADNTPPSILTFPDADSIVVSSAPIVYWRGFDRDGEVYSFEHIDIVKGDIPDSEYYMYFDDPGTIPDQITGSRRTYNWNRTNNNNDTLYLSLLEGADTTEHLVCVRGLDSDSVFSEPVCRVWYRTNKPPDSLYVTTEWLADDVMDTVWCLMAQAYSWNGIKIEWFGHDPDNSIILEYKWALVEVDNPSDTAAWSVIDDRGDYDDEEDDGWTGSPYSGEDKFDGWIRGKDYTRLYDIPTGNYQFRLHIRDDAFYEGEVYTKELRIVKPSFDPTDTAIVESIHNRTFEHKILVVDETADASYKSTPSDSTISHEFYNQIFEDIGYPYKMVDISQNVNTFSDWVFNKDTLAKYSIIYWFDGETSFNQKLSPSADDVVGGIRNYIDIGGNFIIDGRQSLTQLVDERTDTTLANAYFGYVSSHSGEGARFNGASGAVTSNYSYPDLELNTDLADEPGMNINRLTNDIVPFEQRSGGTTGMPFAQPIYYFVDTTETSPSHMRPLAIRFTTTAFKTAYFAFPMYFMDNSEGAVTEAVRKTIEFVTERHLLTADDDTTESTSLF